VSRIDVYTQADLNRVVAAGDIAVCRGNGWFEARGSAHVVAWGSAHVEARGSAHVEAWGSAHVVARGSAHVVAWGSAHVEAWESAHVEAWESAHVEAGDYVAVHQHGQRTTIRGGVIIPVPRPDTAALWCSYHGVEVVDGVATLYKAVRDDFRSRYGMRYQTGDTPAAPDWDGGVAECGGGLHFSPHPTAAKSFDGDATRYVACPVRLDDIVVHPDGSFPEKVKAPGVAGPVWECDIYGEPLVAAEAVKA